MEAEITEEEMTDVTEIVTIANVRIARAEAEAMTRKRDIEREAVNQEVTDSLESI